MAENISAVLLSLGESSTQTARDSLLRQTFSPHNVTEVFDVTPFSRAFNEGVSRVTTEFFVQCDADFTLDPNCIETLAAAMTDQHGLVIAPLRDPLQGLVSGVKLFRTQLCRDFPLTRTSNCEIEQVARWREAGWRQHVLEKSLGTHRTDLSDKVYNFERFRLIGYKASRREHLWDFTHRLMQLRLRMRDDPIDLVVAMFCGAAQDREDDGLGHWLTSPDLERWRRLQQEVLPRESVRQLFSSHDWADWLDLARWVSKCFGCTSEPAYLQQWRGYLPRKFAYHVEESQRRSG
jgi:glycosyltransferase involved in cell wall biosynthesis